MARMSGWNGSTPLILQKWNLMSMESNFVPKSKS